MLAPISSSEWRVPSAGVMCFLGAMAGRVKLSKGILQRKREAGKAGCGRVPGLLAVRWPDTACTTPGNN